MNNTLGKLAFLQLPLFESGDNMNCVDVMRFFLNDDSSGDSFEDPNFLLDGFDWSDSLDSMSEEVLPPMKRKRVYKPISDEARLRRNARRRQTVCHVRLPKGDFRRQFPSMMMNAVNSHDMNLVRSFVYRFCRPDCHMIDFSRELSEQCGVSMLNVCHGSDAIAKYSTSFDECSPDGVASLQSTEIRMTSDVTTIICRITLEATIMVRPKATDMTRKFTQLLDQGNRVVHSEHGLVAIGPQADELNEIIHQRNVGGGNTVMDWFTLDQTLPQAPDPIALHASGFIVLKMDINGMIVSLDMFDAVDRPEEFYLSLQR